MCTIALNLAGGTIQLALQEESTAGAVYQSQLLHGRQELDVHDCSMLLLLVQGTAHCCCSHPLLNQHQPGWCWA
jgi:hypothetical protein